MNKAHFKTKKDGFTIIETMITISIFLVVLMMGMSSLLNASSIFQKSKNQRSIMDNLSFIMEEMSRNIRTGYNFICVPPGNTIIISNTPKSCPAGGWALVFESATGNPADTDGQNLDDQWVYSIEPVGSGGFDIFKSTDGNSNRTQLNPIEITLSSQSGFFVTGAEPPIGSPPTTGDLQQPLVTIRLVGQIKYKGVAYPFSLQTTVSQRIIDTGEAGKRRSR
ncbi:MAG: prepilin-type N-terminal cleavage/methylation domain-containing protein [bacterium]